MISLEAYRARVGSFSSKASYIQSNAFSDSVNRDLKFGNFSTNTSHFFLYYNDRCTGKYFLLAFGIFILVLILTLNLNFSALKLLILLTDGDIESNPGPTFEILKVVQGSFHQGHPKFGHTAGVQCACNSLYALCWSTVKRVTVWTTLKEETFAEETFAISRFLAKFAKVCSREIFVIYKSRKFILAKKKSFRLAKVKKPKNLYIL